ncbi:MAG: beta-galactosidase [Thiolinea sp.]
MVTFNRLQTDIIRAHSAAPDAHNFMGAPPISTILPWLRIWILPAGTVTRSASSKTGCRKVRPINRLARQGDPTSRRFIMTCTVRSDGRWWVMEQQPGRSTGYPIIRRPCRGMVRLWTWEAFAHGAEVVAYFRWRQAPMAQEQMHAGLLRPDSMAAAGLAEVETVARELADAPAIAPLQAEVALLFDYQADWMCGYQATWAGTELL